MAPNALKMNDDLNRLPPLCFSLICLLLLLFKLILFSYLAAHLFSSAPHHSPPFFFSQSLSLSLYPQVSPVTLAGADDSCGVVRVMGVAFPGQKEMDEWEKEQEEARRRDHRRIGKVGRSKTQNYNYFTSPT